MSDRAKLLLLLVVLGVGLAWGVFCIMWAIQCGEAGGAFIAPQNSLPVCVAGVRA